MANELVEMIARMNLEQRSDFVQALVKKWPHMAESLGNSIGFELMINNEEKEAIND
jgi:hypothetical protein|tara:strand:- start:780 stop:947 length:168 start_codon:yes stop_codon:yes gene_type:complete